MKGRKYEYLLQDKDVKRWFDNVSRGSIITSTVYLRRLGAFCEKKRFSPKDIIAMPQKEINNLLLDTVSELAGQKKAGSYISSNIKALKSWLAFNDIEVKTKIKIEGAEDTPTLRNERTPTQDQLRKILLAADTQQRVACSLLCFSGFRPETEGDFEGKDGIILLDFPEMEIKRGIVSFTRIPTLVKVRWNLSKAGHAYFTFLNEEGCQYLKSYIEDRIRAGEELSPESPIITPKKANVEKKVGSFIRTNNIGDMIRVPIRKAGFELRPYVLRAYFDTQLMIAESKGLILRDYRAFFMGHKGDIENRYTTNKLKLPQSVIEDMRLAYKRSSQFLETERPKDKDSESVRAIREGLLLSKHFTMEEIRKHDLESLSSDEFYKLFTSRDESAKASAPSENNPGGFKIPQVNVQDKRGRHASIPIGQVDQYLSSGCRYVDKFTDDSGQQKVIIEIPI